LLSSFVSSSDSSCALQHIPYVASSSSNALQASRVGIQGMHPRSNHLATHYKKSLQQPTRSGIRLFAQMGVARV
jgi:hypothetical protein